MHDQASARNGWSALKVDDWAPTRDKLHLWTQIVGKIRMAHQPFINHWWHVPLYVSARELTTSTIPYGTGAFDIEFDLHDHQLVIRARDEPSTRSLSSRRRWLPSTPRP